MESKKILENLSEHLKNTLAKSVSKAFTYKYPKVLPIHLLLALTEQQGSIGTEIIKKSGIKTDDIILVIQSNVPLNQQQKPSETATLPEFSDNSKRVLEKSMLIAYEHGHSFVGTEHLLYGLMQIEDKLINEVLQKSNVDTSQIDEQITNILHSTSKFPKFEEVKDAMEQIQKIVEQAPPPTELPEEIQPPQPLTGNKRKNNPAQKQITALDVFTVNLTDKNLQENIDPVIGREKEINRLINILCRRNKNNPILVGEPGVGKTAIIEGLAKKIILGEVPDILKGKKVLALDLTLMISGTIYRGEFEARLKQIIEEVAKRPECLLFVDEIHNIIGAGSNQGTMDAANILKPALARGQLRCIGATTIDEFKKHITADPALERRFQPIYIEEPNKEETLKILEGIKKYYEKYHHAIISDSAIEAATNLSIKYIHDNYLPDKAIDLIDEAAASVKIKQKISSKEKKKMDLQDKIDLLINKKRQAVSEEKFSEAISLKEKIRVLEEEKNALVKDGLVKEKKPKSHVEESDVIKVLADKLNISQDVLVLDDWENLAKLPLKLKKNIIGQDEAIDTICNKFKHSFLKSENNKKPLASFLFVGPSGVGKTELARQIAKELYHSEKALIKLDMSEFSEQHGISKLLGSPAGYIGYKDRNRFIDQLKRNPYSVVLFDEIDKAHRDVVKILLQILDEGELTDSNGKKVYFRNAIIILTTNVGADYYKSQGIGFDSNSNNNVSEAKKKTVNTILMQKLKEEFGAEVIGRLNSVCFFSQLTEENIKKIVENKIFELQQQLKENRKIIFTASEKAIKTLTVKSLNEDLGARNVEKNIEDNLFNLIIENFSKEKKKKKFTLTFDDDKFKFV